MPVRCVSKELQAIANKDLNEDVSRIPEDIKYIKNWIKKSSHLNARTDDQWILSFLRGCKFSLERTKEKIDTYYTMKTLVPEFFGNRDPKSPEIQAILDAGIFLPLPKSATPDSPRVILVRQAAYDPSKINPINIFKINIMVQDILLNEDDQFTICGVDTVLDLKGFTMSHASSPAIFKKAMTMFQDGYPTRPKSIHFLNIPSIFEAVFGMVKPFMKEKMKSRIKVHSGSNWDELYKTVPKSILPKDYGGDGPSIEELAAEWKKKVESYRKWFLEDEKYKTDEKKRPGKPKTAEEQFGIEGSFRTLNLD